jgi:hypothetical protein
MRTAGPEVRARLIPSHSWDLTHIFGRTRRVGGRRHTVREQLNAKLRQVKTTLRRMVGLELRRRHS